MAKRTYTDVDRARVYELYIANNRSVKAAARDSGIPEATCRDWINSWKRAGEDQGSTDLAIPESVALAIPQATAEVESDLYEVVGLGVTAIKNVLTKNQNSFEAKHLTALNVVTGTAIDKLLRFEEIKRAGERANPSPANEPADPEEFRDKFLSVITEAFEMTRQRAEEIEAEEAELVEEQALEALPAS